MQVWTIVYKKNIQLPYDRPFIAYWRDYVCIMQYSRDLNRFLCSAFPANHMQAIELKPQELLQVSHWMDLPKHPGRSVITGDGRKGNYSSYNFHSPISKENHEKESNSCQRR